MSDAEITLLLVRRIGVEMVAYLAGADETAEVEGWASGSAQPGPMQRARLLAGLHAVEGIAATYDVETARAWLVGANAALDDHAPARWLRHAPSTVEADDVRMVARLFATRATSPIGSTHREAVARRMRNPEYRLQVERLRESGALSPEFVILTHDLAREQEREDAYAELRDDPGRDEWLAALTDEQALRSRVHDHLRWVLSEKGCEQWWDWPSPALGGQRPSDLLPDREQWPRVEEAASYLADPDRG